MAQILSQIWGELTSSVNICLFSPQWESLYGCAVHSGQQDTGEDLKERKELCFGSLILKGCFQSGNILFIQETSCL